MQKNIVFFLVVLGGIWVISEMLFLDLLGIGRFKAKRELPGVAEKLGLEILGTGTSRGLPKYRGSHAGHDIRIDPESSLVSVSMHPIPGLSMSTYAKEITFDTGNPAADRFFKERQAPAAISDQIVENRELLEQLASFIARWGRVCRFLRIQYDLVEFGMKYGNGHYIPASTIEPVISDLVKIADTLQQSIDLETLKSVKQKE